MSDLRGNTVKSFFLPGDLVTLKQDLPNKPVMIVKGTESRMFKDSSLKQLVGIRCMWFSKDLILQTAVFNTKDLMPVPSSL